MNNSILNISILYVEDEPDARKIISEIISRRITKFYTAENGIDALEIYKKHKPDLVLSDIQMPNMDGLQLTEKIKQINPNAKIILITAFTDTHYLLKSIKLQVDGFIVKPIRKEKLIATIKKQSKIILLEKKSIQQEQSLIKSEMKFKKMADLLPLMIFETDIKGNITYANRKALSNYGYTEDELNTGVNLISTIHSKDVSRAKQNISKVLQGTNIGDREYIVKRKDGSTFPTSIYSQVIIEDAKPIGIRGVIIDLTNQRKSEKAVKQQNTELKIRNEELDAFSHTVAHDLKNPLGTMMGFAGLLYEGYTKLTDKEFEKYISIIIRSGDKTQQIINNLLLFASVRKEDAKIDELNMGFIVNEAINHYQNEIEKTNAKIKLPNHWPSVLGNAQWIEEVWVNYLSNALKYGGTPPIIEFGFDNVKERMIRFWIRDNGDGISPENQKLIFKKFERLDQTNIIGHGLGLSIVKRIIKKLGGKVGVESTEGKGSMFYFILPTNVKSKAKSLEP